MDGGNARMPRYLSYLLAVLTVAVLVGGPYAYFSFREKHLRNFRVVKEGVLYRSGQLSPAGMKRILHDHHIKTVITLRDADTPAELPPDHEEELFCLSQEVKYVRITPRPWWAPDGPPPVEVGVRQFLEVMDDPANYPVLVHCFAGVHRTGAYCAIYRMEYEGWANERALEEMKACGYDNLDHEWDIRGFLLGYRPGTHRQKPQVAQ